MLSLQDLALVKMIEELNELSHACAKALQFGLDSVDPNTGLTTRETLNLEFNDVLGAAEFANAEFGNLLVIDNDLIEAKIEKIRKYSNYSKERGRVEVDNG